MDKQWLLVFLLQSSWLSVNVANICERVGEDHFPDLGDQILQPESIRSNFNDFDTPRVRMTIYIYSLHSNSRVEFFQNSSIDLQICFSMMSNRSREIEITELLLQRNGNSLYEILHFGTRNYTIQNGTCAPWRSHQICCIRFPINSDWIEDIVYANLYGIQIRSLGVQGITVRNVDTKIQNCRLQNPASNPQDLVILQNTCTEDQPPLIQFLFQNSCIIYEAEKGKEKNIIIFTSISLVFFIAVTALFSGILCFYLKLKRKINHVPNINLNADAEYAEIADNPPENKYKVHYINYAEEESSYNYGLLDEDHNEEESFYVMPPLEQEELYEQIRNAKIKLFSRDKIKLGKILGSGQFGEVYSGVLEGDKEVAVKTLKDASSSEDKIKFLQEAFIMSQFQDTNVVAMYGAVTDGEPIMLVIELLSEGDLRNHLQKLRYSEDRESLIDDHTLLSYCQQIVNGMVYLTAKHFVHRDLAARNILLSADGVCKIADFGMSRDLMYESYYVSHGGLIPIKWTAPEALNYKKYSTASDVWSYGAVMYEIWSIGCKPFEEVPNDKVLSLIESGYRLPPPRDCPRMIYKIMVECWHPSPSMRPTFLDIRGKLSLPDTKLLKREESNKSSASETSSFTNNPIN